MSEQAETEVSCGKEDREASWYPLRKWWQSSRLFNQDVGLPPFLEPGDPRWMDVDRLQRSLAAWFWPGYMPAPLFVPYISESTPHPNQRISKWRVSMDVAHFSPTEIFLCVRDGFLEVGGKHEEKPDEHGFIARCFTRKYRLPAEVDATKIVSKLSVDGILTVEAPVPETSVPAAIPIPIKVEIEGAEESQLEVSGDQAQPGSATVGIEQEEESRETPARESLPSVPADEESTESLQKPSEHHETQGSEEGSSTSIQPEPVVDGVIQEQREGAEELTQREEQELGRAALSQTPEAADIKQEHIE
ncbi:heat shock protein beta-1 [Odontesthes bonariensis]